MELHPSHNCYFRSWSSPPVNIQFLFTAHTKQFLLSSPSRLDLKISLFLTRLQTGPSLKPLCVRHCLPTLRAGQHPQQGKEKRPGQTYISHRDEGVSEVTDAVLSVQPGHQQYPQSHINQQRDKDVGFPVCRTKKNSIREKGRTVFNVSMHDNCRLPSHGISDVPRHQDNLLEAHFPWCTATSVAKHRAPWSLTEHRTFLGKGSEEWG